MGRCATATYKRLAALLATKRDEAYPVMMGWIRCRLSFSLIRSLIMCVRGARSSMGHPSRMVGALAPVLLVSCEGRVPEVSG